MYDPDEECKAIVTAADATCPNRRTFLSQIIEMLQLLLRLGTFQVSDIVYNTPGGMLGGVVYIMGKKVHERLSK